MLDKRSHRALLFIRNRVGKSALGAGLVTELGVADDHLKASTQLRTRRLEVSLENPAPPA